MTRRCPSEADFTAEASQQWPEKELKHRRLLQNQAWPLQTEKFKIAIIFKKSPQFFKISFTALFGLEHKNNYLKSVIKKPPVSAAKMRHECRSPYVKTFRRSAVVWQLLTEHLLLLSQPNFSTQNHKCPSGNANRLESSYFSSFKTV